MATVTSSTSKLAPEIQKALEGFKLRENKSTLTQEDFLKLLTVQLQHQDPLKPMEDAQFMGTMAQFASLEQTRELTKTLGDFTKSQILNSAQIYLGRQVTLDVLDKSGNVVAGTVSAVKVVGGVPQITIGGKDYATASVMEIKEAAGTATK